MSELVIIYTWYALRVLFRINIQRKMLITFAGIKYFTFLAYEYDIALIFRYSVIFNFSIRNFSMSCKSTFFKI